MITAVTGLNGAGKTSYAAGMLQQWQKKGIQTAANIGVTGSKLVRTFDQLMELRDCVLLVDEVTAVASSRQFASLTPEALLFFQTLRHSNIGLIWTAPTFDRADVALRSLTLYWVHMTALIATIPKGGIWANTHVAFKRSGRPIQEGDSPAKMLAPWPGLYLPARHHAVYDSYADVDLFTRSQKFPTRCPQCGVGIDYGRMKVATERGEGEYQAAFFCPQCAHELGAVVRPLGVVKGARDLAA
ncbi:MAG TPA: AAA family ATPase [Galbitalea sp.]|nr:AAA family ATPase [Galbitalea sp.]